MAIDILLVVAFTAIAQSVFGVGVLLFGTPILLLLGYDYVLALGALLPVSLAINLLQVARHHASIDTALYRKILLFALPPIAVFLFLITRIRVDIGFVVGLFLLLVAGKEYLPALNRALNAMMRHEPHYIFIMGTIHGLSNLGGSLLTALVHHKKHEKNVARTTIAACYATFAAIQMLTLVVSQDQRLNISFATNGLYLAAGALVFLVIEKTLFIGIAPERYRHLFAAFLSISGIVLLLR